MSSVTAPPGTPIYPSKVLEANKSASNCPPTPGRSVKRRIEGAVSEAFSSSSQALSTPALAIRKMHLTPLLKWTFQGQELVLEKLEEGRSFRVFRFYRGTQLNIDGQNFNVQNLVVKFISQNENEYEQQVLISKLIRAVEYSKMLRTTENAPFASSLSFLHSHGFLLMQELDKKVSTLSWAAGGVSLESLSDRDKHLLAFVKGWLTISSERRKEVINDLRPDNVMWGMDGHLYFCDIGEMQHEEEPEAFYIHLASYIKEWASGNEAIKNFLIEDMEAEVIQRLQEIWRVQNESERSSRQAAQLAASRGFTGSLPRPFFDGGGHLL